MPAGHHRQQLLRRAKPAGRPADRRARGRRRRHDPEAHREARATGAGVGTADKPRAGACHQERSRQREPAPRQRHAGQSYERHYAPSPPTLGCLSRLPRSGALPRPAKKTQSTLASGTPNADEPHSVVATAPAAAAVAAPGAAHPAKGLDVHLALRGHLGPPVVAATCTGARTATRGGRGQQWLAVLAWGPRTGGQPARRRRRCGYLPPPGCALTM